MADTFGPIDAVYKQRYAENVALAISLMKNPYDGLYMQIPSIEGRELQAVELVGSSEVLFDEPEKASTPDISPKHEGIYVQPRKMSWGRVISKEGTLKAGVDYSGIYVQESAAAFVRGRRDIIRNAIFGSRLIRNDAANAIPSAVAFDLANRSVAVNYKYGGGGAAAGLTPEKFIKAMERIGITDLDVDAEDIAAAISFKQNTDLYQALQVTNNQYVGRFQLEDKIVRTFMGVKIVIDNKLPFDPANATHRMVPFWAKSGLHFGVADPLQTNIERNVAQQYRPHIFAEEWAAATRSEDEKFVVVYCDETPAGA